MAQEQLQELERRRYYWQRNAKVWSFTLVLTILAIAALYHFGTARAFERLSTTSQSQTESVLRLQVQILESRLEKYRLLPALLVRQAPLLEPGRLDNEVIQIGLQQIRYLTGAAEVALLNTKGQLVSASGFLLEESQWQDLDGLRIPPTQGRLGREYIALSDNRFLYGFSTKLRSQNDLILAVLVNLEPVTQSWILSEANVIAFDANDTVVLASDPSWVGKSRQQLAINWKESDYSHAVQKLNAIGWQVEAIKPIYYGDLLWQFISLVTMIVLLITSTVWLWIRRQEIQYKHVQRDKIYALALESQIEQRTKELRETNEHLKTTQQELIHSAKLATIGQMSTTLSHEYNQPLATMRTYAENAEKFLAQNRLEQVKDNLHRIIQQTERLGNLSKVLMSFARKPAEVFALVNLHACIEESVMLVRPRIRKRDVQIAFNIPQTIQIYGNSTSLIQVFVNLLSNAIDATVQQEASSTHQIQINYVEHSLSHQILIEDDGPGVTDEQKNTIFEPFVTTKTKRQGLGLGLSVVKDIVLAHKGSIDVSNSVLGGAKFIIQIPK